MFLEWVSSARFFRLTATFSTQKQGLARRRHRQRAGLIDRLNCPIRQSPGVQIQATGPNGFL
jgi:hypothetical protein